MKYQKEVLVIDDDEEIQRFVEKVLENSGYAVLKASSVEEGWAIIERNVPHLVILDLKFNKGEGFDFLEDARRRTKYSHVPVIVLSSHRQKEFIYRAVSLGAVDYSAKPCDPMVLVQKVKKALKDSSFPIYKPEGLEGHARTRITGTITAANENGVQLEVPCRIKEGTNVRLISPLFRLLGCEDALFQRSNKATLPGQGGQFLNEISVIGLTPAAVRRIRSTTSGWEAS